MKNAHAYYRGWTWDEERKTSSCMFIFRGHQGSVRVLEVWNGFLLSGSQEGQIKAWGDTGRSINLFCEDEDKEEGGNSRRGRRRQKKKKKKPKEEAPGWYTLLAMDDDTLLG